MMKYVPSLDGVRGLAVVRVMLPHFGFGYYGGGSAGVDLFFALSGYLISRLLLAEHAATGNLDIRAFYIRRALRLLPALGCMFLLTWAT